MTILSWILAWRTIARDRARAALAVVGVAVIGALLFDMLLLSRGLLVSFRNLLDETSYDVRVIATDGLPMLRLPITHAATLADEIGRLREVRDVALVRLERAVVIAEDRSERAVTFVGSSEGARGAWRMVAGENLPGAHSDGNLPPLVVSRRLAARFAVVPGSTVRIAVTLPGAVSAVPPLRFRIVGIADFQFEAADELTVATTIQAFERAHGSAARDEADVVLAASRPDAGPSAAVAAIARLRPDLHVYSNEQVLEQFNQNGFTYFRQISLVLSSLTLGFAFLLLATLLTVSVNQRLGEVAALRALGLPRRRIAANLLCESALLVGTGGLLAVPLGGVIALQLDRILRTMPGLPERLHFFVLEPRAVILHACLLAGTGFLAALYPVWLAVRLPIAATLRREVVS